MLTASDTPTIRNAINKRLGTEPGVKVCDIKFHRFKKGDWYENNGLKICADAPFIGVGVLVRLGDSIICRSRFDLPVPFEIAHLHAEIDEIAEQYKKARKDFFTATLPVSEEKHIPGTGPRGRWARYG